MPKAPDHTGRIVARRYRLDAIIGDGGFGRVYRAFDQRLDTPVAVKVIHPYWTDAPEWIERFEREAKTAARIAHPGIVRVTDTGIDRDVGPFTVAELVDGTSLRTLLDGQESVPADRATELVGQAADALGAAHDRGIVHRDVKPANLLLDTDGRVRVCDFGIARLVTGATRSSAAHTLVGTPDYMSPEQASGKAAGPAADQYALAVVLFELLTGRRPFAADTPVALAIAHINEPPPELPRSIPAHVRRAIERALSKTPSDRYPDIRAFAAALQSPKGAPTSPLAGAHAQSRGRDPDTARTVPLPRRRIRRRLASGIIVALAAIATGTWAVIRASNSDSQDRAAATGQASKGMVQGSQPSESGTASRPTPTPTPIVTVPRLAGLEEDRARSRATRRGLTLQVTRRHSVRQPAGRVVSQRPRGGARLAEGSTVRVTISDGPPPVTIPQLAGTAATDAQARLQQLGLSAATREIASARTAGTVIRTEPPTGTRAPRGSRVTLVVARPKRWETIGSYSLDSDGSTPSFRIRGRQWRITYTLRELDCEYSLIGCSTPILSIDELDGYGSDDVDLSRGTHTIHGPDGPGRFRLTLESIDGEWAVKLTVQQQS